MSSIAPPRALRLTKHHGLANDFLVLVDLPGSYPLGTAQTAAQAAALCDRHTGVGADGLIRVTAGDPTTGIDVTMELRNADGGRAEMSGNGIRCLAQAVIDAGVAEGPELAVMTDAGLRRVRVGAEVKPGLRQVTVDMGQAREERSDPIDPWEVAGLDALRMVAVNLGNPHLVVLVEKLAQLDVARCGPALESQRPGGANIEFITCPGTDRSGRLERIELRVWERGAGETQACGTGACAAAYAAHRWGLVESRVIVSSPGGEVVVELGDTIVLTGPTQYVATVEVPYP